MTHTATHAWTAQKKRRAALALLGLVLALAAVNVSIKNTEAHLSTGDQVLLKLAPVDPRSLMQGDYMILNFELERDIFQAIEQSKSLHNLRHGYAVIQPDANRVGRLLSVSKNKPVHLSDDKMAIFFRVRSTQVKFATNAFFFQEGHATLYEEAVYGEFRVHNSKPLLTNMIDKNFQPIRPDKTVKTKPE